MSLASSGVKQCLCCSGATEMSSFRVPLMHLSRFRTGDGRLRSCKNLQRSSSRSLSASCLGMNTKFETCLKLGSGCDRLRSYFRHHRSAVQIKPLAILETYFCKLPGYRKMPVVAQFCKVTVIDPKQKDGFEISFTIPKLSREDNVESKQKTMPNLTLRLWLLICILINGQISECHTYSRETVFAKPV